MNVSFPGLPHLIHISPHMPESLSELSFSFSFVGKRRDSVDDIRSQLLSRLPLRRVFVSLGVSQLIKACNRVKRPAHLREDLRKGGREVVSGPIPRTK